MIKIDQIAFENYDKAFEFISGMDGEVEEGSLFYLPFKTGNPAIAASGTSKPCVFHTHP